MNEMYLNNAGAGLMSEKTYETVIKHMQLEMRIGAYNAATEQADKVDKFYLNAARMLNAKAKDEIAYIDSASRGWNLVLYGLKIKKSDKIVTLESEYGTNLLTIYDIVKKTGCSLKIIKCCKDGSFELDDLENELKTGGTILAISHVTAQGSIINPVVKMGKLAQKYGAIYIVDGCQAVGQIPVDVQQINCDAYITAGRKWLRGPRGTGILYVRKGASIYSPQIDLASADLVFNSIGEVEQVKVRKDARQFELWEKSTASLLGLENAIEEYLDYGVEKCADKIYGKAVSIRHQIALNGNLVLVGNEKSCSGIVGFYSKDSQKENEIKNLIEKNNFIISYMCDWDCPIFFPTNNGNKYIFRISPHYYTPDYTIEHVCRLIQQL